MNIPVAEITEAEPIATFDEFAECAAFYAWTWRANILDKQTAVDCAQRHAELWFLIGELGQDEIQRIMAQAFESAVKAMKANPEKSDRAIAEEIGVDHKTVGAARRSVGEDSPPERIGRDGKSYPAKQERAAVRPYRTAQATIDAFWYVLGSRDTNYIAEWLAQHPLDAPHLHRIWEAKCSIAAA